MDLGLPAILLLAFLGAAIGSFLNVVAYRLPLRQSIVRPRSRCPSCDTQIASYDNLPVLSWLMLRGRCRNCDAKIPVRYPLIEALTACLFVAVALKADSFGELWPGLVLVSVLVLVAAIDIEHRIVPNRILAPAALTALLLWLLADPDRVLENLIAGAAAGGFLLVAALAYPGGMGMGDVKLAAVMGFFLGRAVAPALLVGFALGVVVGVGIMAARGLAARKQAIPFAPYLAVGGIVGQLFGGDLVNWYLDLSQGG
jgi:leader peptidase (prepilin peptidase) / N-methyltransferase